MSWYLPTLRSVYIAANGVAVLNRIVLKKGGEASKIGQERAFHRITGLYEKLCFREGVSKLPEGRVQDNTISSIVKHCFVFVNDSVGILVTRHLPFESECFDFNGRFECYGPDSCRSALNSASQICRSVWSVFFSDRLQHLEAFRAIVQTTSESLRIRSRNHAGGLS